jgi:hypothetical protein
MWTFSNTKKIVKEIMEIEYNDPNFKPKLYYLAEKLDEKNSIGQFLSWLGRDKEKMSLYLKLYSKCTKQNYEDVKNNVELFADIYRYLYNAADLYIDLDYTVEECNELRHLDNLGGYHI